MLSESSRGKSATAALQRGRSALATFLQQQGAGAVRIHCGSGQPPRRGRTGKLQRVIGWRG